MSLVKPLKEVNVESFNDFCSKFNYKTDKVAGDDGYDIELIEEVLGQIPHEKWLVNFIEDREDGYFKLQLIG